MQALARPTALPARLKSRSAVPRRTGPARCVAQALLAVPSSYGWVMGSVAATAALIQWQAIRVAIARKDAGIKYPQMYATGESSSAMKFNCTQRSHQNTLEYAPGVLAMQTMLGLAYPEVAAGLGLAWVLCRVVYTLGYSSGDPKARTPGAVSSGLVYLVLILATGTAGLRAALGL